MRSSDWSSDVCSSDLLGGGAAANGGCRIGQAQPFAQLLIGGAYPVGDGGRKCAVEKAAADRPASLRKAGLSRTIGLQMAANIGLQIIGRNELAIGGGRGGETRRNANPCGGTCDDHLADRTSTRLNSSH